MRKRSWTIEQLIKSVDESTSYRQVIAKLGLVPTGGNYEQIKKYIAEFNLPINHFRGKAWSKGLQISKEPIYSLKEILVKNSNFQSFKLKKRLFKEGIKSVECELCHWSKKSSDGRIPLELDHINGDRHDNRIENLRVLCPNCHSMQPTHRGLNRRKKSPSAVTGSQPRLKIEWGKPRVGSIPTSGTKRKS